MLIAEAGTGTGKTFAYLVPALTSGKRVIVSTGTKTLQDQLFHRDLPQVRGVLDARVVGERCSRDARIIFACTGSIRRAPKAALRAASRWLHLQTIRAWSTRTR